MNIPSEKLIINTHYYEQIENGIISNVEFQGGCNGNLKAISRLVNGKRAEEIASVLAGNTCGMKNTSCADQLSKAIEEALKEA